MSLSKQQLKQCILHIMDDTQLKISSNETSFAISLVLDYIIKNNTDLKLEPLFSEEYIDAIKAWNIQ